MDCWPISCTMATCESGSVLIWGLVLKRHRGALRLKGPRQIKEESAWSHLYVGTGFAWIIQPRGINKIELPSHLCEKINWIKLGSILSALINCTLTRSAEDSARGIRDLELLQGTFSLCYLHWPIKRPIEGVLLCACVFAEKRICNFSGRKMSCTHTHTHTHTHFQRKGEKDVTGKSWAQLALPRWNGSGSLPPREEDIQYGGKGGGRVRRRAFFCSFKLKRVKHDFSIKSNKATLVKNVESKTSSRGCRSWPGMTSCIQRGFGLRVFELDFIKLCVMKWGYFCFRWVWVQEQSHNSNPRIIVQFVWSLSGRREINF